VLRGKKVLEAVPDIAWDKGGAALLILNRLKDVPGGYLPIMVGDDVTDEAAFRALEKRGITVRIGRSKRKKTLAGFYLKNYRETLRLLEAVM
ncbi:MAG: hypothetical protein M0Z58_01700, partial [Nitrospiraceae bacterium]|nr:hypothetical protein [Nitrospiraceae bacterium]